jgi:hypothetical protein
MDFTLAADFDFKPLGDGIHALCPDAVKAA